MTRFISVSLLVALITLPSCNERAERLLKTLPGISLTHSAWAFGRRTPKAVEPVTKPVGPGTVIVGVPSPTPQPTTQAQTIIFSPVKGYTKEEAAVLVVAQRLVNESIQSSCFERFFMSRDLIQTGGLTNSGVIKKIQDARLIVPVTMYEKFYSNVVGYRQPPDDTIYTNRKFHAGATACARASNLGHEALHDVGFGHDFNPTTRRPFSVNYSYNAMMSVCCTCQGVTKCKINQ